MRPQKVRTCVRCEEKDRAARIAFVRRCMTPDRELTRSEALRTGAALALAETLVKMDKDQFEVKGRTE